MKKAVVTGAGGFVGKAVVDSLCRRGWHVYAVIRPGSTAKTHFPAEVQTIECDISETDRLPALIGDANCAVFMHFAWSGTSGPERCDERLQLHNVASACASVRAAAQLGCSRYIFAGSIMQYELLQKVQQDTPLPFSSLYAAGKLAAYCMANATASHLELPFHQAIISHIYGPNDNPGRLIAGLVGKLLSGEHVALTAGEQDYDFIYLDDAADAFVALAEGDLTHRAYYIGTEPRPLRSYLQAAGRVLHAESLLGFGEIPFTGNAPRFCDTYDLSALREDTGFVPSVSFEDGIMRLASYMQAGKRGE